MLSGEPKSAGERPGNARKEPCRQTLVVLQHINILRETSEFRSHGSFHSRSPVLRQYECVPTGSRWFGIFYMHRIMAEGPLRPRLVAVPNGYDAVQLAYFAMHI